MKKYLILSLLLCFVSTAFAQQFNKIKECAIEKGVLKTVEADYNPATGDRSIVVNGVRKNFYDVYPKKGPDYAEGQPWFYNSDTVKFTNGLYIKYGLPRVLGVNEIAKAGIYKGVGVYFEAGLTGTPEVIYIPVRQGCEFQPYQIACGRVRMEDGSSTSTTRKFIAKTTDVAGKVIFEWTSNFPIIKGKGTSTVVVDIKNAKDGDLLTISVVATGANKCPVSYRDEITIEKPEAAPSTSSSSKWTANDRTVFMNDCIPNTRMTPEKGKAYCSCMLVKIEKAHPNPATVDKELKKEVIEAWAKECLPKN
jgi:hypothetical protein